jgi:hypothetical protein
MHASADIPFISLRRTLDVGPLLEARTLAVQPAGWAAIFVRAFGLVARDLPALRTLYAKWPWPHFYELPRCVAMVAVARVEDGEDYVLPQKIAPEPGRDSLAEIDRLIQHAKTAPIEQIPAFRKMLRASALPLPLRRLVWLIGLNIARQRANYFGSLGVTSVAAYGGGELQPLSPGPFLLSYDMVSPAGTIDVMIRWDHRITDAALVAKAMTRLEQMLNNEIAAELRGRRLWQAETKPFRAVAT